MRLWKSIESTQAAKIWKCHYHITEVLKIHCYPFMMVHNGVFCIEWTLFFTNLKRKIWWIIRHENIRMHANSQHICLDLFIILRFWINFILVNILNSQFINLNNPKYMCTINVYVFYGFFSLTFKMNIAFDIITHSLFSGLSLNCKEVSI